MKRKTMGLFFVGLCTLAVASCGKKDDGTFTKFKANVSTGETAGDYNLAKDIQDGAILHAWNWSYNTIKANLKTIAASGYSAVQTSPVQQSKSIAKTGSWSTEWAKLYQPVAFHVAEDSYLGTKEELQELCTEAKKYGIRVVCDIVVNHMGNDEKGTAGSYSARIEEEEPDVWANRLTYFHQTILNTSDDSAKSVTQHQLSNLPDLNTGNKDVQAKVTDLLKECIDLGVTGFRFDAAKHIETPDDEGCGSDFWPTVLGAANTYAEGKGFSLYSYGEVLNTPGTGRKWDSYTKYMSITDTKYSSKIGTSLSQFANSSFADNLSYTFSENGTKAVVWAESHDTYADKSSSGTSQEKLNRVYAVEMSHGGAAALYFARPYDSTAMGDAGTTAWKSAEISAVNNFHNSYLGVDETVSFQEGLYINERGKDAAMVVSATTVSSAKEVTFKVGALADGTYYDQVTGNTFTVADGVATGKMGTSGIVVLEKKEAAIAPEITIKATYAYYYGNIAEDKKGSAKIVITVKHADEASYTINGGEAVAIEKGTARVEICVDDPTARVVVTATNAKKESTEEITLNKVEYREGYAAMAGLKATDTASYFAWVWASGKDGKWIEVEVVGDVAYVPFPNYTDYNNYLLVSFSKDMTLEKLKGLKDPWAAKLGQTSDVAVSDRYFSVEASTI